MRTPSISCGRDKPSGCRCARRRPEVGDCDAIYNLRHQARHHDLDGNLPPQTQLDAAYTYESGQSHGPSLIDESVLTYDASDNVTSTSKVDTGAVRSYSRAASSGSVMKTLS